jgi:hypothetical protein
MPLPAFFLVVSRQYGVNGGDPKKIDTKSIILDFDILEQMKDPSFIDNLKSKTALFIQELKTYKESGTHSFSLHLTFFLTTSSI